MGCLGPPRVKRRRTCSASAVPSRSAVAYLTIWSYCWAISSQSIGRRQHRRRGAPTAGRRSGPGRYSRAAPMFFSRGSSRKPSRWQNANADDRRAVRVGVVAVDLRVGAVAQQAFDHRRDLARPSRSSAGSRCRRCCARRASRSSRPGRRSARATRSSGSMTTTRTAWSPTRTRCPAPHHAASRTAKVALTSLVIAERRLSRLTYRRRTRRSAASVSRPVAFAGRAVDDRADAHVRAQREQHQQQPAPQHVRGE